MNSDTIQHLLRHHPLTKCLFNGVYAADNHHLCFNAYGAYVVNTDPQHKDGQHWIVVLHLPHKLYYFDSYGLPPAIHIAHSFKDCGKPIHYHRRRLQGSSPVCGHYCLFFILTIVQPHYTLKVFTTELEYNDLLVQTIVRSEFSIKMQK